MDLIKAEFAMTLPFFCGCYRRTAYYDRRYFQPSVRFWVFLRLVILPFLANLFQGNPWTGLLPGCTTIFVAS